MFSGTMAPITATGNPCGKRSPGGTSKVHRAERLSLGERGGVPAREDLPWGSGVVCPHGKTSPGGRNGGCSRAGRTPLGERGVCPHGENSPRGTGGCVRAGKTPLGERGGVPAREDLPWGKERGGVYPRGRGSLGDKPRCAVRVSRPRGQMPPSMRSQSCHPPFFSFHPRYELTTTATNFLSFRVEGADGL